MKTIKILMTFFLLFNCVANGQKIIVDENIRVDSTKVEFKSTYHNYIAYTTIDNKTPDSLKIFVQSLGLSGYTLSMNLIEPLTVEIVIYSDINEFDGKHHLKVELETYKLVLNKNKFELGETLMGIISGETKEFLIGSSKHKIYFDGHFHHIIGKVQRKRYEGDKYDSFDPRRE
jgi:hypothetical protein